MNKKLFSVGVQDAIKGLIVAFLSAFLATIYQWISNGGFPTAAQFKQAGIVGISSAVAYLLKNYFSNSQGQFAKAEPPTKS